MTQLVLEYILFVAIAACGVLQIAVFYSNLRGLLFFQSRKSTYAFALVCLGGAFGWFFGWDNRLDGEIMHTGVEGAQQFGCFLAGASIGVAATVLISSLVNRRPTGDASEEPGDGLGRLRNRNYISALRRSFGKDKE
jgi:hypothetical protein